MTVSHGTRFAERFSLSRLMGARSHARRQGRSDHERSYTRDDVTILLTRSLSAGSCERTPQQWLNLFQRAGWRPAERSSGGGKGEGENNATPVAAPSPQQWAPQARHGSSAVMLLCLALPPTAGGAQRQQPALASALGAGSRRSTTHLRAVVASGSAGAAAACAASFPPPPPRQHGGGWWRLGGASGTPRRPIAPRSSVPSRFLISGQRSASSRSAACCPPAGPSAPTSAALEQLFPQQEVAAFFDKVLSVITGHKHVVLGLNVLCGTFTILRNKLIYILPYPVAEAGES